MKSIAAAFTFCLLPWLAMAQDDRADELVDVHIHYSHDAWDMLPPEKAILVLQEAGLKRAFVSSSSDEGTQKLYALDPDLIVPVLRPYRKRGETSTWMHDESVPDMLAALLDKNDYAGIGEFHAFGDDIDLPVLQSVIELAKGHNVFLHAHSDADAVERIFATNPDALVVWAHSGFDDPEQVGRLLAKYPNLWTDLAFRSDHAVNGEIPAAWREVFTTWPDRFLLGTDTYTPERWYYVLDQANLNREWLSTLPEDIARKIAWENAETLLSRVGHP